MGNVNYILGILVVVPLIILIHELGHAFFARIFGGEITNITLGMGKKICTIGILDIRMWYFVMGSFFYKNLKKDNKLSRVLILLGGVIFNIASIALVFIPTLILYSKGYIKDNGMLSDIVHMFLNFSVSFVIFNLLPIKLIHMNTDGLQIYKTIKFGESSLYGD